MTPVDYTDAMVGDPVHDFVELVPLRGRSFVADVIAHHGLSRGDGFGPKLEWISHVLTLTWLADAAVEGTVAVNKHVAWVELAFSD